MFSNDFKRRIIRYLEKFYEFPEKGKKILFEDDFFFLRVVCCNLKQLITELHYSVNYLRNEAVELEKLYFLY